MEDKAAGGVIIGPEVPTLEVWKFSVPGAVFMETSVMFVENVNRKGKEA